MKFGAVASIKGLDLSLPRDHPDTARALESSKRKGPAQVHVGCAQWNKQDLKNFYPKGTKDELAYYATQFNAIELNATFYRQFPPEQFATWAKKVPAGFRFFPKVVQDISHLAYLKNVDTLVDDYVYAIRHLGSALGAAFLQMHENFSPADGARIEPFLRYWPKNLQLALEFRHPDWYNNEGVAEQLYDVLEKYRVMNIITDTAGRRDLLHMRLTTPSAFIRYVGANDPESDRARLDEWVSRLRRWVEMGIEEIHFFVHQNHELESPLLAAEFIRKLNNALGTKLHVPVMLDAL
ncbi:MAG: DUF72 domain-containing protein [Flavobacteriales bacterium]|nr:DUF72 domain-containing protein [Flavobacteriales bacterium]HRH67928.1 DUF72 domain-containing protein [Flavobacteriales bacterium]